jgi:hypothetical protein
MQFIASPISTKLRVKRLSTEYIEPLVGMAFPRAATTETAMNGFRNRGLWPVDHFVFMDDDFAPSIVTERPETIQLQAGLRISALLLTCS